ncbi:hypothetical protein ACSNOH_22280 [Streptomyces sp. URMC 127]|uniref:hypothetical protein n=1 Tax=Streptomyces sp. URMC 127 TaxID=3423402 RepID=UPI003F1CB3B9
MDAPSTSGTPGDVDLRDAVMDVTRRPASDASAMADGPVNEVVSEVISDVVGSVDEDNDLR